MCKGLSTIIFSTGCQLQFLVPGVYFYKINVRGKPGVRIPAFFNQPHWHLLIQSINGILHHPSKDYCTCYAREEYFLN